LIVSFIKGWNSWNHFACNINEKLIQQTADIIVGTGLAAAGYQYGLLFFVFYKIFYVQ
jgi:alpha-galactosidase